MEGQGAFFRRVETSVILRTRRRAPLGSHLEVSDVEPIVLSRTSLGPLLEGVHLASLLAVPVVEIPVDKALTDTDPLGDDLSSYCSGLGAQLIN